MKRYFNLKRVIAISLVLLLLGSLPLTAWAAGITQPTGADAATYTYNDQTGLWENDYFTWDPSTYVYTPKFDQPYTYNGATGMYDAPNWTWNAAANRYDPATISVAQPPAGATVIGGPPAISTITDTGAGSTNTIDNNGAGGTSTIDNTGADSTNTIDNNGNNSAGLNNSTGVAVNNQIGSTAASGDVDVSQNTLAGNATSGNAQATANVVNLLQSQTSLQSDVATFTYDIYGNVQGDLMIDPAQLSNVNTSVSNDPNNLAINSSTDAAINNDINLDAASGNATVAQNTEAGNATSGNAAAVVQIVNVINSIISSGQSFVGTVNIYGNFDGDILLPQDTLNSILAANFPTVDATLNPDGSISTISNTGQGSDNTINSPNGSNTDINNTNKTGIDNNVDLTAASGNATVTDNTLAGSATSGSAGTNLVLLNLTGQQIICGDALLVFVNVLGNWVGMIVNAPSGSTAAALGGGNCSASSMPATNTDVNSTTNSAINNNVKLTAQSGDASVTQNTKAGNATTGNATASANIANIANSSLSFSSWFGILFINVFGSWHGSFGVNTAAGGTNDNGGSKDATGPQTDGQVIQTQVFHFAPKSNTGSQTFTPDNNSASIQNTGSGSNNHVVLAAASTQGPSGPVSQTSGKSSGLFWTAGSLFALAGVLSAEEAVARRKEARAKFRSYLNGITVQPLKRY
jgi:hypothetical protein